MNGASKRGPYRPLFERMRTTTMGRHSTRNRLGCGVLRFTDHCGKVFHFPLRPDVLAMISAFQPPPRRAIRPRNIIVLAR